MDLWIIRWINRLIFFHLISCATAVIGVIVIPILVWEFIDKSLDAKQLADSGTPMKLKLVRDKDERFFNDRGYRFYFNQDDLFVGYSYRDKPTKDLDFLTVYRESFEDKYNPRKRLVEVPDEVLLQTVYQATWGSRWFAGLGGVLIAVLIWAFATYVAIKGYILIKGGRDRKSRGHRRKMRRPV